MIMKLLFLFALVPFICVSQNTSVNFDGVESPVQFIGKTDSGLSLNYKSDEGKKIYRLEFPVYKLDKDQGFNHIDFFASDERLNSLRTFLIQSTSVTNTKIHFEIDEFHIDCLTRTKEFNGVEKVMGGTEVTIVTKNDAFKSEKTLQIGEEIQLGYFDISKSEVERLFGKQKF